MSIDSPTSQGSPIRRRPARSPWLVALALVAVVFLEGQQSRPAPKFEGKRIPDPPSQGQPWTAPATTLPKFLVNATGYLFDQGVADPRGCEYRRVEIGTYARTNARGFVLPERDDTTGRFVVCWDGLIYPALSVGEPADLDRDVQDLVASLKQKREAGPSNEFGPRVFWSFPAEGQNHYGLAGVNNHSPIKICMLLRLGRAEPAEALFAAGTNWTPKPRTRDLTNYGISYLSLAHDWAASAFERLIGAHVRGDDVIALDTARRLAKFRDLASAKAEALGFPMPEQSNRGLTGTGVGPSPRFYFLTQLDDLLRDHERRAKMPERGPIPGKGKDPAARIAALIRDLDQIDERQMMSPGSASPGSSPLVRELVAEGDPAVAPLLEVLATDNRLTRSVSNGRGFSVERFVHPVYEAAFAALIGILKTQEFADQSMYGWKMRSLEERKKLADSIRRFWEKTRSIPLAERWYRTLRDDSAGQNRWLEAAGGIVAPVVEEGMPMPKPGTRPLQGEALRDGREPSVTALILRRAGQLERQGDPQTSHDPGFQGACRLGVILATWDEQASLPLLQDLSTKCRARADRRRDQENAGRDLVGYLSQFTQIRTRLGDVAALDEFAAWLRTSRPGLLEHGNLTVLQPLLDHPEHPALASAARWLFNDPKSPWVPLLPEARGERPSPFQNLFASPLIVVAGFREGVLAGLADKTPLGTLERNEKGTIQRRIKNVPTSSYSSSQIDLENVAVGVEYSFRNCDELAWKLSSLEGSPRFDLFWPEARRDEALIAYVAYIKRYGDRFTTEPLPGVVDFPESKAHLRFPILGKPATQEDVAATRAIFSLEGEGETRLVSLPGLPQAASWVALKDSPVTLHDQNGVARREYESNGVIWQAEEVRKGDGWERYYGFVGRHVIARVPASEIEFVAPRSHFPYPKGGLDTRTVLAEPRKTGYEAGQPIVVAVQVRNHRGVTHTSPTAFLRPAPDGKPALRKGVNLTLWYWKGRGQTSTLNEVNANEPIEPKRDAHFDAGKNEETRSLAPLETFEAMRLDLNDWFDLTKPGGYRLRVAITPEAGLGEGASSATYFQVRGEE